VTLILLNPFNFHHLRETLLRHLNLLRFNCEWDDSLPSELFHPFLRKPSNLIQSTHAND